MYVGFVEVGVLFVFKHFTEPVLISYLLGKIELNLSLKNMAMCT